MPRLRGDGGAVTPFLYPVSQVAKVVGVFLSVARNDLSTRAVWLEHGAEQLRQIRLETDEAAPRIKDVQAAVHRPIASHSKHHVETAR